MEIGEKLLHARQEAGLSQRQLCGDRITRNMLSQIEHGTARPSMDTLRYLAERLGKPVSFFLEEHVVTSPNQDLMASAWRHYAAGDVRAAWVLLQSFQQPDTVLEWEWRWLSAEAALVLARQAIGEGKCLYARQILEERENREIPELERKRLLLLGTIPGADLPDIVSKLPSLDEELRLRAEAALGEKDPVRAEGLLLAAEDRENPKWNLLRGRTLLLQKQYLPALACLEKAEGVFPQLCWPLLEECCRELGDFRKAYVYACKQR